MSIWPRPKHIQTGEEVAWLSAEATCKYHRSTEHQDAAPTASTATSTVDSRRPGPRKSERETAYMVQDIFHYAKSKMFLNPFVQRKLRGEEILSEPPLQIGGVEMLREVIVEEVIDSASKDDLTPSEWYYLQIQSNGNCLLRIGSTVAMHRAMATFVQLFQTHSRHRSGLGLYCGLCPLTIEDMPSFQHRGLNLDISRNRITTEDVRRTLEGMWLNKMNKLHIHATDSQSWPIEIRSIPELAKKGAYDASQIWTALDVEMMQRFGEDRGIEVYFEIDLPGHTASIHHAFPELIVAYNKQPWNEYAKEPPAGQLKLKSEEVRDFIDRLLNDFLPRVKRYSKLFHIGGDEINKKVYTLEEGVESESPEVLKPLLQSFYNHCIMKLGQNRLNPILWEEVLLRWDLTFPKSTIIQSWKSQESLSRIVKKGHRALFGPAQHWYLDTGLGGWVEPDPNNPDTPVKHPFPDWCPPYKNWRLVYTYDPLEGIEAQYRHLILGGEVHLWTEMVDSACLDFMLWPRVAAAAEVLWSGPTGKVDEGVTMRLAEMRERLVHGGIRSGMVQMEWCLRNPGCSSL